MYKTIALVFISLLLLTACGRETIRYESYPLPVYVVPPPPEINRPHLPIYDLSIQDVQDTPKVLRAYVVSVRLLLNYAEAKEAIASTYKSLSERAPMPDAEEADRPIRALSARMDRTDDPETRVERSMSTEEEINILARNMSVTEDLSTRFSDIEERYRRQEEEIWGNFNEDAEDAE